MQRDEPKVKKSKKKLQRKHSICRVEPFMGEGGFYTPCGRLTTHRCLLQVGIPFPCSYGERSSYHTKLILQECMRTYLTVHAGWEHVTSHLLDSTHTTCLRTESNPHAGTILVSWSGLLQTVLGQSGKKQSESVGDASTCMTTHKRT